MVRKGNRHRNILDHKEQKEKSKVHSQNTSGEGENETNFKTRGKRNNQRHHNFSSREKSDVQTTESAQTTESFSNVQSASEDEILFDSTKPRGNNGINFGSDHKPSLNVSRCLSMETLAAYIRPSLSVFGQRFRLVASSVFNVASEWLEQQKPWLSTYKGYVCEGRDFLLVKINHVYPYIWPWIFHLGQLIFLLSVVWLDCNIRGLNSLARMGTTSFFTVVWCSVLSAISMVGFTKAVVVMAISAMVGTFIGLPLGILILGIFATVSLWLYGSFWTTALIILIGGSTFALSQERVALLVTTIYSMYCAKSYVGWLGLLFGLNLSFLSSDILTYVIKNNTNDQDTQNPSGSGHFYGEPSHSSPVDDVSASQRSGVASTSGCDGELTSEGEVGRLLSCNDHYSALGFTRFENIDISLLKREYRKKAMLVHPDKNMGNEKAPEAFKKLQNAYEVLLDTLKRKTYDDELRREELLNYFRRFQSASQKNGRHNFFSSGSPHFEADDEGSHGESRRITCKRCGDFHKWIHTERPKARARWCQDCNDFHSAKDGDGWLEQSLQPILFGLLHKVDAPCAYICADGRIYDATEWFICQGMRCPANTHKPTFHVNTALSSKHSPSSKGRASSCHRASSGAMPNVNNIDETMSEEEFLEWLQNAMQSGVFKGNGSGASQNDSSPTAKNSASTRGSNSLKKKRKGKKQC